ncbi:membrane integrity-associated transporter subunit PqiC [Hafnia psychrotolerans]|nr:membrane integrity-associated transporter subunit PqiC [Hafnia psychrotolerans]
MMKWIPVVLALFLTACSSSDHKTYYQLPILSSTTGTTSGSSIVPQGVQRQLWVENVSVADYLAGNGLVFQTNDVQYVLTQNNLWASPLDQQLQQSLVTYLGRDLPGRVVSAQPASSVEQDVLNVNVTGFHGRYDGSALISGSWVLTHNGQTTQRNFNLTLKQNEDGYDALVRILAVGWQQEAGQIAKQIK